MIMVHEARNSRYLESRLKSMVAAVKEKRTIILVVEPSSKCNLSCTMCDLHSGRMKDVEQYKGVMSIETFQRTIDEFASQPFKLKELQYHGNGEPLLNKELSNFIAYAKKKNVADVHRVTTNGTLLVPKVLTSLVESGVDEIHISLDVIDTVRYKNLKGGNLFQKVEENIDNIIELFEKATPPFKFSIKCVQPSSDEQYGFTENDLNKIIEKYRKYAENSEHFSIRIMPIVSMMDGVMGRKSAYYTGCESPFYSLFVKYNGWVTVCCADSTNHLNIANIRDDSLENLLNSEKLRSIRRSHLLKDFKEIPICLFCGARTVVDSSKCAKDLLEYI